MTYNKRIEPTRSRPGDIPQPRSRAAHAWRTPTLGLTMTKRTHIVGIAYGAWAMMFLLFAIYGALFADHGEYGISAHLWLTLTGVPLSFVSWFAPHGSVLGVSVAGLAGIVQWGAISEFWASSDRRKGEGTK